MENEAVKSRNVEGTFETDSQSDYRLEITKKIDEKIADLLFGNEDIYHSDWDSCEYREAKIETLKNIRKKIKNRDIENICSNYDRKLDELHELNNPTQAELSECYGVVDGHKEVLNLVFERIELDGER